MSIQQDWASLPTYEELITPYKQVAKDYIGYFNKLTDAQHAVARLHGKKDWQELTYFLKMCVENLKKVDFSVQEWACIYDPCNGSLLDSHILKDIKKELRFMIIEGDKYNYTSNAHLDDPSKFDDYEGIYEPSKSMLNLLEKIESYDEDTCFAIFVKAYAFWKDTLISKFLLLSANTEHA